MPAAKRTTQQLEIEGRSITVSNLDKVLYPGNGWTKSQIIDFYIRISPYLLPHFYDRPVTLKRYPDGFGSQAFWEKDAPKFTPKWVTTFPVPRRAGGTPIRYVLINDLPTLVWCANIASLELHPFLHKVPAIDRPTFIVFDLDPGPGTDILTCAAAAFEVKEFLANAGLECFAKTSGSKGLQLYVPLNAAVTYEQTQPFAKRVAETFAHAYPDRFVAEMAKVERPGKIFIDWSQNSDFKTTVGPYSLRAKVDVPFVSMPVTWEELREACDANDKERLVFRPEPGIQRLAETGDLFEPVLKLKQRLPRKFPELAKRTPASKRLRGSTAGLDDLPASRMQFIAPMQAQIVGSLPEGPEWQYEVKFDGYRALAIKRNGEIALLSRRSNSYNTKFSPVVDALEEIEDGAILDGEIVALNEEGRPVFNVLQHYKPGSSPIVFYAFDCLAFRGKDTTGLPLRRRRELLEPLLPQENSVVKLSVALHAAPDTLIRAVREQGLEGIVAKRLDSRYEPGQRSGAWVKFKTDQGQELVVGGYRPSGNHYFDNLAVGYYDNGRLIFIAKLKNGYTPEAKQQIFTRLQKLETDVCPFDNLPESKDARRGEALTAEAMKNYKWIRPKLVVQAQFTDWTSTNHLRHAKFVGIRDDKDPREVVHELPA